MAGTIRVGIGGWTFEPWRGVFYPKGLPQRRELEFASRHVTTIEVNATYYSPQKPGTFAKWAAESPEGFVFALKASRFCTNRRILAQSGESVERFLKQGLVQLGDKLGPILWQFMVTKTFDPDDFAAFLKLLPAFIEGLPLRHCVEVRNASFADPDFIDLCRERGVAICCSESPAWPLIADPTADFVYARLMKGADHIATSYESADLDAWTRRLRAYARGDSPHDLPLAAPERRADAKDRDVFAFFISADQVRAPAAASALLERLARPPAP